MGRGSGNQKITAVEQFFSKEEKDVEVVRGPRKNGWGKNSMCGKKETDDSLPCVSFATDDHKSFKRREGGDVVRTYFRRIIWHLEKTKNTPY